MPLAITGASGHIGYHVARLLLERGHQLRLLLRPPNVLSRRLERLGAQVHVVGLFAPQSGLPALSGAAALFHLAAAQMAGVSTIVGTSSVVVLGRSTHRARLPNEVDTTSTAESPSVRGKVAAERVAREAQAAGRDVRIVYPSWVVGPDDPKLTFPGMIPASPRRNSASPSDPSRRRCARPSNWPASG